MLAATWPDAKSEHMTNPRLKALLVTKHINNESAAPAAVKWGIVLPHPAPLQPLLRALEALRPVRPSFTCPSLRRSTPLRVKNSNHPHWYADTWPGVSMTSTMATARRPMIIYSIVYISVNTLVLLGGLEVARCVFEINHSSCHCMVMVGQNEAIVGCSVCLFDMWCVLWVPLFIGVCL